MKYPKQSDYLDNLLIEMGLMGINENGGTDKATDHSYTGMYEEIFTPFFSKPVDILEIGIYHGGSLALWSHAFENANITGCDISDQIKDGARKYFENVNLIFGDAYAPKAIDAKFDIIIDDGPHTFESFVSCLDLYVPRLNDNGILIIEDIKSMEQAQHLAEYHKNSEIVDHRAYKGRFDDICLIVRK
jgi:predicted O-methyltransferase YrrM